MTRVDFYLIKGQTSGGKHRFACRVTGKAYSLGHKIYLHTRDADESRHLDEMLWTFGANSFIPHAVYTGKNQAEPLDPVLIGHEDPPEDCNDVLISLTGQVPAFFSRFQRLAELVDNDGQDRKLARERFRFYRDRGYPLNNHEVTG